MIHEFAFHISHVTQAILPLIIGLIAGAVQAEGQQQQQTGQLYAKGEAERMSPWSHLPIPNAQYAPAPLGTVMQGGFAGLQYAQQNPTALDTSNPDPTEGTGPVKSGDDYSNALTQSNADQAAEAATGVNSPDAPVTQSQASLNPLQLPKNKFAKFSPWSYLNQQNPYGLGGVQNG